MRVSVGPRERTAPAVTAGQSGPRPALLDAAAGAPRDVEQTLLLRIGKRPARVLLT